MSHTAALSSLAPTLTSGLGLTVCDARWELAIAQPRHNRRVILRTSSGAVLTGESFEDTVQRVLARAGFKPGHVGVSNHDTSMVDAIDVDGVRVVPVSPTIATLSGLPFYDDSQAVVLHEARARIGASSALLKVGPRTVSCALSTDDELVTHRFISPEMIAGYDPAFADFRDFLADSQQTDSVELLGNRGWKNAAWYLHLKCNTAPPTELTLQLMKTAISRRTIRTLVSHLCVAAMNGDEFAGQVALFMSSLLGRTIGHVDSQNNIGTLYVQANSISAVTHMPNWVSGRLGRYLPVGDPSTLNQRLDTRVVLIGPRPQVAEAIGASQVAATAV